MLLALEGTVLLASAFTPKGLTPPPAGIIPKLRWLFKEQAGVPLSFNQPLFYVGILLLLGSILLGNITGQQVVAADVGHEAPNAAELVR